MATQAEELKHPPVTEHDVGVLRGFHRLVTERVGALDDEYLARGRSLGASRLLWEIGRRGSPDTLGLRTGLDLDSGYLSRLLRSLEADGLIHLAADERDRRVKRVNLTTKGRREVAPAPLRLVAQRGHRIAAHVPALSCRFEPNVGAGEHRAGSGVRCGHHALCCVYAEPRRRHGH